MKYSKVKVGDRVKSCLSGWGEVRGAYEGFFKVYFEYCNKEFYRDGKTREKDINPEIIDWEPKVKQWEPKYFDYSQEPEIRKVAKLAAYKKEFNPDFVADWDDPTQNKYYPYYNHDEKRWEISEVGFCESPGSIGMDKEPTKELVKKLNSGEVVL